MLVPELRPDKNGRMTTRWVKPKWAREESVNKGIPIVKLAEGNAARNDLLRNINGTRTPREGLREAIAVVIDHETAVQLNALLRKHFWDGPHDHLANELTKAIENPETGKPLIKRIITHFDRCYEAGHEHMIPFMVGLSKFGDDLSADQEWALLEVTNATSRVRGVVSPIDVEFPFEGYALASKELSDYIIENPDEAVAIGKAVVDCGTDRLAVVKETMDGYGHGALIHGTL